MTFTESDKGKAFVKKWISFCGWKNLKDRVLVSETVIILPKDVIELLENV